MTNVEQYINNYGHCFPSSTINTDQEINIPKRCSRHLLVDKYLSEYKTEQEKRLVMLNILLMDTVPMENSTRLVNSGTVYKVMREGKLGRDQLTELFNYLQRSKADKSELFSKDYRELINTPDFIQLLDLENYYDKNEIDNIILNISLDNIDLSGYATQEYVLNQINNLIDGAPEALNTLKEITDKLSADGDIVNLILNLINEKANKSDVYTKIQLDNLLEIEQENISGKAENSDLLQTNELVQQLLNKILLLESKLENIKHEILTLEMYDNLQQYDPYTVYFIVEQLPPTPVDPTPIDKNYWAFGDGFPVIFSKNKWRFGLRFPIIFSEGWTFGDGFPIIFSPGQESLEEQQEELPNFPDGEPIEDYYYYNGYYFVDLGLPSGTLWATRNVNLYDENWTNILEDYYVCGSGLTKWGEGSFTPIYEGDLLSAESDTATLVVGTLCHMPTKLQIDELLYYARSSVETIDDYSYYKFTNLTNSDSYISINFNGYKFMLVPTANNLAEYGIGAYIGSSTKINDNHPYLLHVKNNGLKEVINNRVFTDFGVSIRGVMNKSNFTDKHWIIDNNN